MTHAQARPTSRSAGHGSGVIVIGAHRSGTSLLAGLLRALRVHIGHDCAAHEESTFFRGINVRLLRSVGASWYRPEPMEAALRSPSQRERLARRLRTEVSSPGCRQYLGDGASDGPLSIEAQGRAWGWKDPRSTVTLPLWLGQFPDARVIHIVRNGIDVARSLVERERATPRRRFDGVRFMVKRHWPSRWPDAERKARPFRDLREAFELWATYVRLGGDATRSLGHDRLLVVRYEDMLADPGPSVQQVAALVGQPAGLAAVERWVDSVNSDRRYAFVDAPAGRQLLDELGDHAMMRRFGYDRTR